MRICNVQYIFILYYNSRRILNKIVYLISSSFPVNFQSILHSICIPEELFRKRERKREADRSMKEICVQLWSNNFAK